MTDVLDGCLAVFRGPTASGALAERLGSNDATTIAAASEVAVPLVLQAIRHQLGEPASADRLAGVIGRIDPADLADPAGAFESGRYAPQGLRLVDQILMDADSRGRAARAITEQSGLEAGSGAEMLSAAAWSVGAQLHHRAGSPPTATALLDVLDGRLGSIEPPIPPDPIGSAVATADDVPLYRSVSPRLPTRPVPSAIGSAVLGGSSGPTDPEPRPSSSPAVAMPSISDRPRRPEPRPVPDDDIDVGSSVLVTGLTVLLALLVAGFGLWWWLDRQDAETATSAELGQVEDGTDPGAAADGDPDDGGDSDGGSSDDSDDVAYGVTTEDAKTDEAADDGSADGDADGGDDQLPSLIGADGRAFIDVAMLDPVGRSTATGAAALTFDTGAGEICYEIGLDGVGEPADGHIHLGPAGVKGGIIVDFGPMSDGLTGCQPVPAAEMEAILADLDSHYFELHDPVEEFTVRAQLSEGTGADGQPVPFPAASDAGSGTSDDATQFDPDGGGAIAIVEPDRIVLRGAVADRETAERVLVDFAGLSEVVVIDELTIEDGAPLPSGRVIIDSPGTALFAVDSDVLDPAVDPLIERLVGLLEARPDWVVTVVGHTDPTGDDVSNLELSFERAEAVRAELLDAGIDEARVRVRGAGSTDPLAGNDTAAGRAENRRIEFEIER